MKVMASLLDHYLQEMAGNVLAMEQTEVVYKRVVDAHIEQYPASRIIAEQRAATHPDVQQAVGDGAWYRDKAKVYALGAIALMLHEQRGETK